MQKRLTILHSNDMHGDFLAEMRGEKGQLIGGLALLSGYLNQVRREEENVLYAIAGDMLQGSVIDTEYKGISTMEMMNYLAPDIVTLGNHEFDYGLPHLLFLEKVVHFPIVNANLYIKPYNQRLMRPYCILERGGLKILFIGVITEKVLDQISQDRLISTFVTLTEASQEIGRIINAYKHEDIDLTVLLTHIGFDDDVQLAGLLQPAWGVDLIIGGHSHTVLDQPALVNGVMIVQAGVGSDQIGRLDLTIDQDENCIADYRWRLIPVDDQLAAPDEQLQAYIHSYQDTLDRKYSVVLTRLARQLTHPVRTQETELGNLATDILAESALADVAMMGSGAIRQQELGPLVTLGDFLACFPFEDSLYKFNISGSRLWQIFRHILNPDTLASTKEFYQVSRGVEAVYNWAERRLESLRLRGVPVADDKSYSVCVTSFHLRNAESFMGITERELSEIPRPRIVATSMRDVLEEYLRNNQNLNSQVEGRLVYV